MSHSSGTLMLLLLALGFGVAPGDIFAQANPAHTHVGHVASGFPATPDGQGLLPAAIAEAAVVAQHIRFAANDNTNLPGMQNHAGHALHALDPGIQANGPGLGFGLKRAADGIAQHIGLAAGSEGASGAVQTHASHVLASASTVSQRVDQLIEMAQRVQSAPDYVTAGTIVDQMLALAEQLTAGRDADGNGSVGWQEGEGGLDQITQHMGLLTRAEGID